MSTGKKKKLMWAGFALSLGIAFLVSFCVKNHHAEPLLTEVEGTHTSREAISSAQTSVVTTTAAIFTETTSVTSSSETEKITAHTETERHTSAATEREEPMQSVEQSSFLRDVPYETEYVYSSDMYEGEQRIISEGVCGLERVTLFTFYENGVETGFESCEETLTYPENEKILVGTRAVKTTRLVSDTESLPFETEYIFDPDLYDDARFISRAGACGEVRYTYRVTYYMGDELLRELYSAERTEPTNEIIKIGTKPSVTKDSITVNENTVGFSSVYENDPSIYEGETRTEVSGSVGYDINTYEITYRYGEEVSRRLIKTETVAPINTVIRVGTKKKEESFRMPFRTASEGGADYGVTQYFGGGNNHGGIDFGVYYGSPILAAMSGTVLYAYNEGYFSSSDLRWTYGTYVVIDHGNGYLTYYAHLSSRTVSAGDTVSQGEVIGYSGNTGRVSPAPTAANKYAGTHLHFEIRKYSSGSYVKVDPKNYLPRWN